MSTPILALALCGIFPFSSNDPQCASCGCRNFSHGACAGKMAKVKQCKEKLFGSWYLDPMFDGSCNDRFFAVPPAHHGYYTFRPYNYRHIAQHSQDAAAFGEDPQMPYANETFRRRYRLKPEATPDANTDPEVLPTEPRPVRPLHGPSPKLMPHTF